MAETNHKLKEASIADAIKEYLFNKPNEKWYSEGCIQARGHEHGADLIILGGESREKCFVIECKSKSYANKKSIVASIDKEGWLNALGQLVTRMDIDELRRITGNNGISECCYAMGLYWIGAKVALRRIPMSIAKTLNLHVFSVDDAGSVRQWQPEDFGKEHPESCFHL